MYRTCFCPQTNLKSTGEKTICEKIRMMVSCVLQSESEDPFVEICMNQWANRLLSALKVPNNHKKRWALE